MKSILCASLALVAGVAFAEEITRVSQNFELTDPERLPSEWVGDGKVTAGASVAPSVGSPTSAGANAKFLAVDGTVSCSNLVGSANSYSKADFLLYVDEAGDDPEDVIEGAQIAVAAGEGTNVNNSCIWVYCKNGSPTSSNAWFRTDVVVPTQTWARVTLDFDYTAKRCQVSVNGEAANSAAGYVKSSGDATGGSWYPTIHTISGNSSKLSELTFVGSTKVDDVLISESDSAIARFTGGVMVGGVTVPYDYLATYSIKPGDAGKVVGASGLTVAQKYETGLDPTDDSKFIATSMTLAASGETATVTIPCVDKSGIAYKVIFKDAAGNQIGSDVTPKEVGNVANGLVPLTFDMPNTTEKVLQIQVTATKSNS